MKSLIAIVIFVASFSYFLTSATLANRGLFPTFHDECMYLLQAQMLAHGRLWMPEHPLGAFFDSFFVIVKPVYASSYFPGTAIFNVPGVWLNLAPSITAAAIASLAVVMIYLIAAEMIDGVAGLLAALLAISLEQLRVVSVMTMSHSAMLLLFLLAVWAYLNWRKERKIGWAMALGVFAGWAAITRPLDAVCVMLPLFAAMIWNLRKMPGKRAAATVALVIAGAVPFLSLQLLLDNAATGHILQTPITAYGQANFPGLNFGLHPYTGPLESPSPLPQVRDYYRVFLGPMLREHGTHGFLQTWIADRWRGAAHVGLPAASVAEKREGVEQIRERATMHILVVFLPLGLLALRRPAVGALACAAILFPLASTFYPTYLNHYALVTAPAYILLVLFAGKQLSLRFPISGGAFAVGIVVLALGALPEIRRARDHFMDAPYLADINIKLANLPHTPAVVLFHYETNKADFHEEPVFNIETPSPDDAAVIRAHDLGQARNQEIFNYYAKHQPNRFFYLYDRTTTQLKDLGWAKDLDFWFPR